MPCTFLSLLVTKCARELCSHEKTMKKSLTYNIGALTSSALVARFMISKDFCHWLCN